MALPDTYKQVEYIESSGTQYIDTGYIITVPKYDMDFEFVGGESSSWIPMLGIRDDSVGGNRSYFGLYVHSGSLYVTPNYGGFDPGTSSGLTISKNTKYNIVEDEGQFYIDGVYKSSCSTTNTYMGSSTKTLYIFAMNNRDDIVQYRGSMMKLYYFKLYDNGTLVRDFVPVIRKSDSKPGLYDLVNNVFYTNAGTGEFNYKEYPESGQIQKIYIGVDQVRPKEEPTTTYNADFSTFNLMTTYWGGTPTYSNGIIKTTGEGGIAYKDVSGELDVNNAKKIVMECDYYAVGKTWATTGRVYLDNGVCNNKGQSQSGYSIGQWVLTQTASGYNTGTLVTFCGKSYGSATAGTEITYNTRHHLYAEFDIQNATWLCKVDDVQKGSGTLDSENITNYHNMTYSYINMYIETNNQIKNLSIQVTK